ncbi:hypothetical protein GCM10027299_52430 [Larkinella ripae]
MNRGRKPTAKPYIDVLEEHPWKRFPLQTNNARYLILGSFPPNKFTHKKQLQTRGDVPIFYGSKSNKFWNLFITAKGIDFKWPDQSEEVLIWFENNQWAVADIVYRTYRKEDSAIDTDLIVKSWNTEIIDGILKHNKISRIFFTSRWVEEKFNKYVKSSLNYFDSKIHLTTLISPSDNGLRRTEWCKGLLEKNKDEPLSLYRQRYYSHFLKDL